MIVNLARNIFCGFVAAYGWLSFACFFYLDTAWARAAPRESNSSLGAVYGHNEHGSITYFTAFQATTCWLMFNTSIPLGIVAILVQPKKNITGRASWFGFRYKWDADDPSHAATWAAVVGTVATPFLVFVIGPHLIRALNASGFVMNLG